MEVHSSGEVTVLLQQIRAGDSSAVDRLIPLVLHELRTLARMQLKSERAGHTLQPTALVNEAYFAIGRRSSTRLAEPCSLYWSKRLRYAPNSHRPRAA